MANRVRPIVVSERDRQTLEHLHRAPSTPGGLSRRARAVLLMAQGVPGVEIAERAGYTVVQISRLRRRFAEQGVAGLHHPPRPGPPPPPPPPERPPTRAPTPNPPPARP